MYGWLIRYFIIKFAPIHKCGCRDYMKWKAYLPDVCEHRGFITKDPNWYKSSFQSCAYRSL